jgi:hypothetical protein
MLEFIMGKCASLSCSDFAAWVQAIGSILAILGAVWISRWEIHQEKKFKINSISVIAKQVQKRVNEINEIIQKSIVSGDVDFNIYNIYSPLIIEELASLLDQTNPGDLQSEKRIEALVALRIHIPIFGKQVDKFIDWRNDSMYKRAYESTETAEDKQQLKLAYLNVLGNNANAQWKIIDTAARELG